MNDQILSVAELEALTGYCKPVYQRTWLRDHLGVTPFVSRKGRITVFWSVVREAQRRENGMEAAAVLKRGPRPNLKAVK